MGKRIKPYLIIALLVLLLQSSCKPAGQHPQTMPGADAEEVALLKNAARKLQYSNPDSALKLLATAISLNKKDHNNHGVIECYQRSTLIYSFMKNDVKLGRQFADSAWQFANQPENRQSLYIANYARGMYFMATDDYNTATNYFLKANKLQPPAIDSIVLIGVNDCLAQIYATQHNYPVAINYYTRMIRFMERNKDTFRIIITNLNVYNCYKELGDTLNVKHCLFYSKYLSERINNQSLNSMLYYNIGTYYFDRSMPDSCIYYLNQSLYFMGLKLNGFDRVAKPLVMLAKQYFKINDDVRGEVAFRKLGAVLQSREMDREDSTGYYELSYLFNKQNHQVQSALSDLELLNKLKAEDAEVRLSKQLLNYEVEIKKLSNDKVLIRNRQQLNKQKLYTLFAVLTSLLLLVIAVMIYLYWKKKKNLETLSWQQKAKEIKYENEKALSRLQNDERNRIAQEMHDDLGASLTSVLMAVELVQMKPNDPAPLQMISRVTHHLSRQVNEIVWNLNLKNDNLQSLIDYLSRFARPFLDEAGIALIWDDDAATINVPVQGYVRRSVYLTFRELINNIVKHSAATRVLVTIIYSNGRLSITIQDNGIGMDKNRGTTGNGNGLINIEV